MGSVYRRGRIWWLKYSRAGRAVRESAGTSDRAEARALLRRRTGAVNSRVVGRTFVDAATALEADYVLKARRSLEGVRRRLRKHILPTIGHMGIAAITAEVLQRFATERKATGASSAEVNRELAVVRRALRIAASFGWVSAVPQVPGLPEGPPRQGFVEPSEFARFVSALPAALRPPVAFAFATGWRLHSEVLPLTWDAVDLAAGEVRLAPGTGKTGAGRVIHLPAGVLDLLQHQRAETDRWIHETGSPVPWVFSRQGRRIRSLRKAWNKAWKAVGLPPRIPHDLRRTAVRNLVRAGVAERVAMQVTGHQTRSVFERYNIVSTADLVDAAERLEVYVGLRGVGLGGTAATPAVTQSPPP
jgi:integrase